MPKIPMAEKAGMIRHVSDTVHMQGAPALNWKLDEGQALSDMGDKIGRGAERLGGALMAYGVQMQETEDRLNAARIESLWKDRQSALETRMAGNPEAFEQFGEWAHEADSEFMDAVKPFREKMSKKSLELFDARMDGLRKETFNRRQKLSIQARVTADYNLFQAQWKDAALRGDLENCNKLLADHRGKLISEQEYEQKKLDFDRLAAFGEAKRLVEADPAGALEQLKARDKDGNYANFKNLESSRRDALLRAAEAEQGRREREMDLQVLDAFRSGTAEYTQEYFDQQLAMGEITHGQHARYMQWMGEFEAREKRAANYQASQKEKAEKAVRKQQSDRFLNETLFDENGRAKSLSETDLAKAAEQARKICGKDYDLYGDLLRKLNGAFEKKNAYRDTPLYKDGENLIAGMRAEGKLWAAGGTHWWNRDDKSYATGRYVERNLMIDLENYVKDHPQANQAELSQYLTGRLEFYQKSTLTQIAAGTLQERNLRLERKKLSDPKQPLEGTMGTYRGRRVIFTNGEWKPYAE